MIKSEIAEQIVREVSEGFRKARIYPPEHPICEQIYNQLSQRINLLLSEEITFSVVQDRLFYDAGNILLEEDAIVEEFAIELHQRGISKISFQPGVEPKEIRIFFGILSLNTDFLLQQDIEEFFKEQGLWHIKAVKLFYKQVSPVQKAKGEARKGREYYFDLLNAIQEPEEMIRTFEEVSKKDWEVDIKAEFLSQGIREINRLLVGRLPLERERFIEALSEKIGQFPPLLISKALEIRRERSLREREEVEGYIDSLAAVIESFTQGVQHIAWREVGRLKEEDAFLLELLPYSHYEEYTQILAYLQERIKEVLEKEDYDQCRYLLLFFIEESKGRKDYERRELVSALQEAISFQDLERLLSRMQRTGGSTSEREIVLSLFRCWGGEYFVNAPVTVRQRLFFLIEEKEIEEIEDFLIAELEDEYRELREEALDALGRRTCRKAVPFLLSLLAPERIFFKDIEWERKVIENIGRIGDERAVEKLKRVIEKRWFFLKNKRVLRMEAIEALKRIGTVKAIKALIEVGYGR